MEGDRDDRRMNFDGTGLSWEIPVPCAQPPPVPGTAIYESTEFPRGGPSHGFAGTRGDLPDPAQRGAYSPFHAGGYAGHGQGSTPANPGGGRFANPARQHVPSAVAAGAGSLPAVGWHPRFHELAAQRTDRLRRVSNLLAAAFAFHHRGRRGIPELHGRADNSAQPRAKHPRLNKPSAATS